MEQNPIENQETEAEETQLRVNLSITDLHLPDDLQRRIPTDITYSNRKENYIVAKLSGSILEYINNQVARRYDFDQSNSNLYNIILLIIRHWIFNFFPE